MMEKKLSKRAIPKEDMNYLPLEISEVSNTTKQLMSMLKLNCSNKDETIKEEVTHTGTKKEDNLDKITKKKRQQNKPKDFVPKTRPKSPEKKVESVRSPPSSITPQKVEITRRTHTLSPNSPKIEIVRQLPFPSPQKVEGVRTLNSSKASQKLEAPRPTPFPKVSQNNESQKQIFSTNSTEIENVHAPSPSPLQHNIMKTILTPLNEMGRRKTFAFPVWMRSPNPELIPFPMSSPIVPHPNSILEYNPVHVAA